MMTKAAVLWIAFTPDGIVRLLGLNEPCVEYRTVSLPTIIACSVKAPKRMVPHTIPIWTVEHILDGTRCRSEISTHAMHRRAASESPVQRGHPQSTTRHCFDMGCADSVICSHPLPQVVRLSGETSFQFLRENVAPTTAVTQNHESIVIICEIILLSWFTPGYRSWWRLWITIALYHQQPSTRTAKDIAIRLHALYLVSNHLI